MTPANKETLQQKPPNVSTTMFPLSCLQATNLLQKQFNVSEKLPKHFLVSWKKKMFLQQMLHAFSMWDFNIRGNDIFTTEQCFLV